MTDETFVFFLHSALFGGLGALFGGLLGMLDGRRFKRWALWGGICALTFIRLAPWLTIGVFLVSTGFLWGMMLLLRILDNLPCRRVARGEDAALEIVPFLWRKFNRYR